MTKRSKDTREPQRSPEGLPSPADLAERFREWQLLKKQVSDFEQAAAQSAKTITRHDQEIPKHKK